MGKFADVALVGLVVVLALSLVGAMAYDGFSCKETIGAPCSHGAHVEFANGMIVCRCGPSPRSEAER